jgi:hypothetical protein
MEKTDKLIEFENFGRERRHAVEGRTVGFREDAEAAIAFEIKAHKAGFDVSRSPAWGSWGDRPIPETRRDWFVSLDKQ